MTPIKVHKLIWAKVFTMAVSLASAFTLNAAASASVDERIKVAEGITLSQFATVPNARQMALTSNGSIFVGSRKLGKIHGVSPNGRVWELASGLNMPSGVALDSQGSLYVAAVNRIYKVKGAAKALDSAVEQAPQLNFEILIDALPSAQHHGWKAITLSPDEKSLIVPVGAPCNICLVYPESGKQPYGTVLRVDVAKLNQGDLSYDFLATGVRNSVGMDFHPISGELWFSDNGRDMMGDDMPPCEINRIDDRAELPRHYGYPFIHGNPNKGGTFEPQSDIAKFKPKNTQFVDPVVEIQAHSAPLGIHFYRGSHPLLKGALLVAEHGSWNRSSPVGYRVSAYWFDEQNNMKKHEVLADFLTLSGDKLGRPVDFVETPEGHILVSDDAKNRLWKLQLEPAG